MVVGDGRRVVLRSRAAKRAQSRIGWIGVSQPRAWRTLDADVDELTVVHTAHGWSPGD